jgi:hypothetical protein
MKLLKWICFCCLSVSFFAGAADKAEKDRKPASAINLSGQKAESLYGALTDAGIGEEGHAGTRTAAVDVLNCAEKGRAVGKRYYLCDFSMDGEPAQDIKGKPARTLYMSLKRAGVAIDGGAGTAEFKNVSVQCDMRGSQAADKTSYDCVIKQN